MVEKPLRTRFNKVDGFVKIFDGTRYLVSFCSRWYYDAIYDKVRYFMSENSGITNSINQN